MNPDGPVACAASSSRHPVPSFAVGEVLGDLLERLGPEPDVAVLFVTGTLTGALDDIVATVRALLRPGALIGATARGVIGDGENVADRPGISLWAANCGPARAVALERTIGPDGPTISGWDELVHLAPDAGGIILLADPFSFPVDEVLERIAGNWPGLGVVGGNASAASGPGGNRLAIGADLRSSGAVALVLGPGCRLDAFVGSGARPFGPPMTVTRAEGRVIAELASAPALDRFEAVLAAADDDERELLRGGIDLGIVVGQERHDGTLPEVLVRSLAGADRFAGSFSVDETIPVGSTVQFHLRDRDAADRQLDVLLRRHAAGTPVLGALVFAATERMTAAPTDEEDPGVHDARQVREATGVAVAGMFCAGEFGPLRGRPVRHTQAASIGIIRSAGPN